MTSSTAITGRGLPSFLPGWISIASQPRRPSRQSQGLVSDLSVPGLDVLIHPRVKLDYALPLGLANLLGAFRHRLVDRHRPADSTAGRYASQPVPPPVPFPTPGPLRTSPPGPFPIPPAYPAPFNAFNPVRFPMTVGSISGRSANNEAGASSWFERCPLAEEETAAARVWADPPS